MIRYASILFVPLIGILMVFVLWSWSLRKQVATRTHKLSENEKKYRLLFENMMNGFALHNIVLDNDGNPVDYIFLEVNAAFETITGLKAETVVGQKATDVLEGIKEDPADWIGMYGKVTQTGNEIRIEKYSKPLDKWFSVLAFSPEKDQFATVFEDITIRKQSELRIDHLNKVLQSIRDVNQLIVREKNPEKLIRESCRLLVDNRGYASALIVLTDEHNRPSAWAASGIAATNDTIAFLLKRHERLPCFDLMPEDGKVSVIDNHDSKCHLCPLAKKCAGKTSMSVCLAHNQTIFGYLSVALAHELSVDEEERGLFSEMAADLSYALNYLQVEKARIASEKNRSQLEKQLVQAQKMESVGRLAGGVAHDYNNMLSIIIGYTEMAIEKTDPNDPLHSNLIEILSAANRSADITRQLLAFARQQTIAPRVLSLNAVIENMLKMLRRLIGEDIDLDTDLKYVNQMLSGQITTYSMKKRYFRKDRSVIWINLTVGSVQHPDNTVKYFVSVIEDITHDKLIQDELAARNRISEILLTVLDEEMYAEILKVILGAVSSRFGVFGYIDESGALVVPTMTRDVWRQCEVAEKDIVFPRETWGCSSWPRAMREKKLNYTNERSTLTPKGHISIHRHVSMPIVHGGKAIGLIQVANKKTDYTENDIRLLETLGNAIAPVLDARLTAERQERIRRQAEEALRTSEAALKQAQQLANFGNWEWDIGSDRHFWSEEIYRIYGRDPDLPPAVYPEVKQYFTKETWTDLAASVEKCLIEGTPYECDAEVARPDGSRRWITARGKADRMNCRGFTYR